MSKRRFSIYGYVVGDSELTGKERQNELRLLEVVTQSTKKRMQESYDLYGHDPQEEFTYPHMDEGHPAELDAAILAEAVSFTEAEIAAVDCDDWELEQRRRQMKFKPNWFLRWLFENGMFVP